MSDPNKTISYAESLSVNYKLQNLKRLFKKKYVQPDVVEVQRIEKGAPRRGTSKGSIIDFHLNNGSLEAAFDDIAKGYRMQNACEKHGLVYMTFRTWIKKFPLLADRLERARALGHRARETKKHFPEGNKDPEVITRPHFKPPTPSEIDNDIRTLTQEQLISIYGENSIVLEYALRAGNPNFVNGE